MSSGYGRVKKATVVKSTTVPDRQSEQLKQAYRDKAATKIQRAYRQWQKRRLMRMAAEAIQDSERMMLGRQRLNNVVANIEVGPGARTRVMDDDNGLDDPELMKQSLDVQNKHVWDKTGGDDYSVFARKDRSAEDYSNLKTENPIGSQERDDQRQQ